VASNAIPKYLANIKGIQGEQLNAYRGYFMQECMGQPVLPMVSAEDVQSVQIAPVSEEATFMQYQQFVIAIIALTFGIPPEKLAIAKSNDRSTITEINENLLAECIKPYLAAKADAINKLLAMTGYGDSIVFKYIFEDTLADKKTMQTMVTSAYAADAITRNEMRKALGYPPAVDEYADDFITIMKAKVNKKYGINGFGTAKQTDNSKDNPQKGGE
jgi:phage portal protein BeeE